MEELGVAEVMEELVVAEVMEELVVAEVIEELVVAEVMEELMVAAVHVDKAELEAEELAMETLTPKQLMCFIIKFFVNKITV